MKIRIMKWKEEKLAENFSHLMMKYLTLMVTIKMEAIDVQYTTLCGTLRLQFKYDKIKQNFFYK